MIYRTYALKENRHIQPSHDENLWTLAVLQILFIKW